MPSLASLPLVAQSDTANTPYDRKVNVPVLLNDTVADLGSVTVTVFAPALNGSAVINPDNTITYTPSAGFTGIDTFVYQISLDGNVDFAAVLINVIDGDTDGDGLVDSVDTDDDNDGIPDVWEDAHNLDRLDASDATADYDGDGYNNLQEYQRGMDPWQALSLYGRAVLADNPVAYWPLDEASGATTSKDISGNAWTMTTAGGPTFGEAGIENRTGVKLDGIDDELKASPAIITNDSALSVEAWLKVDSPSDLAAVNRGRDINGGYWGATLRLFSNRVYFGVVTTSSGWQNINANYETPIELHKWYHVVGTWQPGVGVTLWLNGTMVGTTPTTTTTMRDDVYGWHAGASLVSTMSSGSVDDVSVYNTVLSQAQIISHSNASVAYLGSTTDTDGDGIWDAADLDDDNDGMPDTWELTYGLNPLNGNDALTDLDSDGYSNVIEFNLQTNPTAADIPDSNQTYYVLNPHNVGNDLSVISLVDNNTITAGTTTLTLNRNQLGTIPASDITLGATISGSGAFDTGSDVTLTDMQVPEQFAGSLFVLPHFREAHTYYLFSPHDTANVMIDVGGTISNVTLAPGVVTAFDAGNVNTTYSGIVRSDKPIFVSHVANVNDAYPVAPASTDVVGIVSSFTIIGAAEDNTTVTIYTSDGANQTITLNHGGYYGVGIGNRDGQGVASTLHIVADKPMAAIQAADTDGGEASSYLPAKYFAKHYAFPINAQYAVVVCLRDADITLTDPVNGVQTQSCTSNGVVPGKAYFGSSTNGVNITAGASLASSEPVYVMFEGAATNGEQNILGDNKQVIAQAASQTVQPQTYHLVHSGLPGNDLSVMSLVDNNTITSGGTTLTLNRYQQGTIPSTSLSLGGTVSGNGPFDTDADVAVVDMPAPDQFAATTFVIPHFRNAHTYNLLSPQGTAHVTVNLGGTTTNLTLNPGDVTSFDAGSDQTISGIITSDIPILVSHKGETYDAYTVPPPETNLVGIYSTTVQVGALQDNTTLTIYADDGSHLTTTLNKGAVYKAIWPDGIGTNTAQSKGSAYHIMADKPVSAIQASDGDGGEATAFFAPHNFAARYSFPTGAQYAAVVCLQDADIYLIDPVNGVSSQTCRSNGVIPGKAYFGADTNGVNISAGSRLESTAPVYVIFENAATDSERNMLGNASTASLNPTTLALGNSVVYQNVNSLLASLKTASATSMLASAQDAIAANVPTIVSAASQQAVSSTYLVAVANNAVSDQTPKVSVQSAQLLVVATNATDKPQYRVYRKGPETQQQWLETAEDPNSYDRPETVYYVTQDQVDVWQSVGAKTKIKQTDRVIHHERADIDMRTVLAKLGQDPDAWRNAGFIKVNHGTASNPVAVDSEIWSYVYDANGNAQSITRSNGSASYVYDALNRLTSDGQSGQAIQTLGYDRNGNRTTQTANAITDSYGYVANSNQLNTDPQGGVTHDAAGNRLSDHGGARTYEYNNAGRLFKVYEGGSLVATYIYNALGQRTRKTTTSGTAVYHYDLAGQLISETSASGAAQKDYVYLNGMPVAQIGTDGTTDTVNYIHSDHLGTPRRATNAAGTVTWTWSSDAFGTTAANDDPDNDGVATIINLRFPGQYYDAETQLHYNYFRYYDPSSGRYVTSDPIGLNGGWNTYGYVGGNPIYWFDSLGLAEETIPNTKPFDPVDIFDLIPPWVRKTPGICLMLLTYTTPYDPNVAACDMDPSKCPLMDENADAEREKSKAKGVPDSEIGPSGKPKIHVTKHPSRKRAKDKARNDGKGPPMNHTSPKKGGPHYHPTDGNGDKIPGPHHEY